MHDNYDHENVYCTDLLTADLYSVKGCL